MMAGGEFHSTLRVMSDVPAAVSIEGVDFGQTPLTVLLPEGRYGVALVAGDQRTLHSEKVELVYGRESVVYAEEAMASLDTTAPEADEVEAADEPSKPKPATPDDVVARIRAALASGDTDEALALVEKHYGKRQDDPAFLAAAGDTYRRLGQHAEAVDAYLMAAMKGTGKASEKAYLAAARITLEKLRDTGRSNLILDSYWKAHPAGFFAQDARFLGARLLVKQKKHAEAAQKLEALLAQGPDSYLATKAHLLLGSILVAHLGDCNGARPHLAAVQKAAPGGKFADEAQRFLDTCNAK
jgi:tetratricopeptide (TPR) repeat protein